MEDAGVGEQFDAGLFGRGDHGPVLRRALADFVQGGPGRDQQQLVDAPEGRLERLRLGVVGLAGLDAFGDQVLGLLQAANGGNDLAGRQLFQKLVNNQTTQVAGGSSDGDHGLVSFIPG